jgi:prepilin-type N-terminal cleavage/methylation domain-containing protein
MQNGPEIKREGFTIIELMVVIAIISLLIALLLPAVQAAREAARKVQCRNNLKQMGIVLHNYHETYRTFPAGGIGDLSSQRLLQSGFAAMLPFLEEENATKLYSTEIHWEDPGHSEIVAMVIAAFVCPSCSQENPITSPTWKDTLTTFGLNYPETFGVTNYILSKGPNDAWCEDSISSNVRGMFQLNQGTRIRDIIDGPLTQS